MGYSTVPGQARPHVIAGRTHGIRRQFGQWTKVFGEARCGVLLVPDHTHDDDLLGTPLPRLNPMAPLPGWGYLVCDGTIEGVQLCWRRARHSTITSAR